jgi:hypothetical protein
MNIKIEVRQQAKELTRDQLQIIRRIANVLGEHGFDVDVQFPTQVPSDTPTEDDKYMPSYAGAKYPHPGYMIQLAKNLRINTNKGPFI